MALVLADRVRDTTTTTGTGTVTLSGTAPTGYQDFSVIGNGNTTYYTINAGSQWEVGIGTYSSTGPTLARNTVLESSNANALVDFAAGTKDVFVTYPSDRAVTTDGVETLTNKTINGSNNTITNVSLTTAVTGTLPVANGGTGVTTSTGTTSVVLSNSPVLVTPTLGAASATSIANGLGAVGTPSYTFTGDLNTGMWSPGTDTVAFSTNGSERMRINSSGQVGIGTSSPAERLTVNSASSEFAIQWSGPGNEWVLASAANRSYIRNKTAGVEALSILNAGNVGIGTSSPTLGKLVVSQASSGTATLALESQGSWNASIAVNSSGNLIFNNNAATERMRIASDGATTLSVGGVSNTHQFLYNENGGEIQLSDATGNGPILLDNSGGLARFYKVGTGAMSIGTTGANFIQYITNGAERMRIDSSGNVGIGTSAPSFKLDIQGSSAQTARVYCTDSASGSYAAFNAANANGVSSVMYSFSGAGWYGTTSNHPTLFLSNNAERMRIDSSGNVGIGTTSPGAKLDVLGISLARTDASGGNSPLVAKNDSTANNTTKSTGLLFQGVDTTGAGKSTALVQCGPSDSNYVTSYLAFQTRTADALNERMRITDTGNVGIGTSSPTLGKLVVSQASSGTATLALESQGSWNASIAVNSSGNLIFNNNAATERMRIASDGNVGIGTTSPGYRLDVASGDTTASIGYAMRIRSNATATAAAMQFTNSGASSQTGLLACTDTGTMTLQSDGASSILAFRTNGNERMRIDSSGNVGIGTGAPSFTLDIQGSSAQTARVYCTDSASGSYAAFNAANANGVSSVMYSFSGAGHYGTTSNHPTLFLSNNAERMRIDSSGNVGIGTSSVNARLSLGALVSNKVFALYDDGTNQYGMGIAASQYRMFAATGGSLCFGNYARSTDTFTETVRITSDGKVGIGTSSPDATAILDVSSTTAGFLPPRMSTAERDAIGGGAPQEGLILFNVTTDKLQVFSAGAWVNLH